MSDDDDDPIDRSKAIDLFPTGPIRIGRMATMNLIRVRTNPVSGAVAQYSLDPIDLEEYVGRTTAVRGAFGLRYAPLPGLWVTIQPVGRNQTEAVGRGRSLPRKTHELWLGAEPSWLRSQSTAMATLGISRPSLLAPFVVRTLALGYVHRVGF
jgi:hypothetical protein